MDSRATFQNDPQPTATFATGLPSASFWILLKGEGLRAEDISISDGGD